MAASRAAASPRRASSAFGTAVTSAAVVEVATLTFSTATPTVAATTAGATTAGATTAGATTPTGVGLAVAAVAASLLCPTAFLLLLLRSRPQNVAPGIIVGHSQGFDEGEGRSGPQLALHEEWSIADHALRTERSSGGGSDVFLTDARRAEAFATTAAPNVAANSSLGEEAVNYTLPWKKVASPGRSDRELTPSSCDRGEGAVVALDTALRLSRSRVSCAFVAAAAVARSARFASVKSR